MKVLITGSHGYVGPVLLKQFKECYDKLSITCIDSGFFEKCVVDSREDSPSCLSNASMILSADIDNSFIVPEGCLHGYLTLEENSTVTCLVDSPYAPESEFGAMFNDPVFGIKWVEVIKKISEKDLSWPPFNDKGAR